MVNLYLSMDIVMLKQIKFILPLLVAVSIVVNPVYAWQLKPFETTYTATISNMPFDGQAIYSLTKKANIWYFKTLASIAIAQREENSSFEWDKGVIRPASYEFRQSGLKPKWVNLTFDWKKQFVKGYVKDKKHNDQVFFDLKYNILDQLSTQLALQQDIANGKKQMSYRVIEDDLIETYQFKVVANEVIETPIGKINAVKVERIRNENHNKRQTFIWFAKDWNYTVVQLYHLEKNGQEYIISLAQGSVNGKAIKGKE